MKQFLLIILGLLLYACGHVNGQSNEDQDSIGKFTNSGYHVSVEDTRQLHFNYMDRLKPALNEVQRSELNRQDYEETEYLWMPMDKLKEYIAFLESIAAKNNKDVSGVAFYLGAYNLDKKIEDKPSRPVPRFGDYRGRMTMFFAPTYYDANRQERHEILKHVPFYVQGEDSDPFKGEYIDLFSSTNTTIGNGSGILNAALVGGGSGGSNELSSVPPPK